VIRLAFCLSHPVGTARAATATVTVTDVKLYEVSVYWTKRHRPHVGQVGRIRLRNGAVTESITGTIFCGPHANRCGA
jgi:hypothetical protein